MKSALKTFLFPGGAKPRRVWFGAGQGLTVAVDPAIQSQRLLGLAELEISREFVEFARRCRTFCDVGASDGWYCMVARKHNSRVDLVGIEPDADLGRKAANHFSLNGIPNTDVTWLAAYCGGRGTRLDDVLAEREAPVFIKIDIEGAELDALESGQETLSKKECFLLVETHSDDMEDRCSALLERIGYAVRIIPQAGYRRYVPERRPLAHNQWLVASRAK